MFAVEYEPTHKKNVFNPDVRNYDSMFLNKLRNRIHSFNSDTKFDIKKLLNSSK